MSKKEEKIKRIISPLKLPISVRRKLPEAQNDYNKALKRRIKFIFISIIIVIALTYIFLALN